MEADDPVVAEAVGESDGVVAGGVHGIQGGLEGGRHPGGTQVMQFLFENSNLNDVFGKGGTEITFACEHFAGEDEVAAGIGFHSISIVGRFWQDQEKNRVIGGLPAGFPSGDCLKAPVE